MSIFRLQDEKKKNQYLNELYGGSPPSMGYYRKLGGQKRARDEAEKARKKALREAEAAAKKAEKEREKKEKEEALNKLIEELQPKKEAKMTPSKSKTSSKKKDDDDEGFFGFLKDVGSDIAHVGKAVGKGSYLLGKAAFTDYTLEDMRKEAKKQEKKNKKEFTPYSGDYSSNFSREVDRAFKRTGSSATLGLLEDSIKNQDGIDSTAYEDRGGFGGAADIGYDLLGSLVPGAGIAKGLRGTRAGANVFSGMSKSRKAMQYAKEGSIAGGIYGGADALASEAFDPNERDFSDHLKNIGLEVGFGAVADPAISSLFDVLGKGARATSRGVSNRVKPISGIKRNTVEVDRPVRQTNDFDVLNTLAKPPVPEINLPKYGSPQRYQTDFQVNQVADPIQMLRSGELSPKRQGQIDDLLLQKYNAAEQMEQARNSYAQARRNPYEAPSNADEVASGISEWENAKKSRQEYDQIRKNVERFRIPEAYREEYSGLVPRSFIDSKAGNDIFNAAEAAGFRGDHEGALEFAQYLRNMQQTKNLRKKDLVPEAEPVASKQELDEIENIGAMEFPETPEYQAGQRVLDAYDEQIKQLEKPNLADAFNVQANTKAIPDPLLDLPLAKQAELPTRKDFIDFGNREEGKIPSILNKKDRALSAVSDRGRAVKVVERAIQKSGKRHIENAYRDYRLVPGSVGAGEQYLSSSLLKPIKQLEKEGLDLQAANEYAHALHLKRVKELNPDYVLPGGANIEQMNNRVARLGRDPRIKAYASTVRNIQQDMLDMLTDSEVISPELRDALTERFPDYIPLFRQNELSSIDEFMNKFQSGNIRKVIRELEDGSTAKIKDPLDNLVNYVMNAHQAAFTNRAMKHITSLKDLKLNGQPLAKDVTSSKKAGKFTINFKENGETVTYDVHPDLFKAYNELKSVVEPNKFVRFVEGVASVQRQSITANPIFTVKQFARDIPEAYINGNFSLVRDLPPAILDMVTGGRLKNSQLKDFYKNGAGYGNLVSYDRRANHALKRAAQKLKGNENIKDVAESSYESTIGRMLNALRNFNESVENIPKLAQYRSTLRKTGDEQQAAFEARDLMDFSMAGSTTQKLNRSISFLNASIRGKERFARAIKDRPLQTVSKMSVVGAGMSSLSYLAYENLASDKQKSIIENAPAWLRQTYWMIPHENGEDILRIPKPYEMSTVVTTPLEYLLYEDNIIGPDVKEYVKTWASEAFGIDPTLNPVSPLYELTTGQDLFSKRSIANARETHLPAGERGDVYTSTVAKGLGKLTNQDPRNIDHLIEGYLPVTSENVNDIVDRIAELSGKRVEKPAGSTGIENLFNPFIMNGNTVASNKIGHIYDAADEVQGLKKRTQNSGEVFPYPNAYRAINKMKSSDQELSAKIRAIDNDPNLDRNEKKELREQVIEQRNELANRQVYSGRTKVSESNLESLEQEFSGLGAKVTKTDLKQVLNAQLTQKGIPKHVVDEVMKQDLDEEQLVAALRTLLQENQ